MSFVLIFSLTSCAGAGSRLSSANRKLSSSPYRVTTKISFASSDAECAAALYGLGGANFPMTVDGDAVMVSAKTTEHGVQMELTLRVIDGVLYYYAEAEGLIYRFFIKLSEQEKLELDEKYLSRPTISYSDFKHAEFVREGEDSEIICTDLSEAKRDAALGQILVSTASVRDFGSAELIDATMHFSLKDGKFRLVTTEYRFSLAIGGRQTEATMRVEQAYVYDGVPEVTVPSDLFIYDEVSYRDLFGE